MKRVAAALLASAALLAHAGRPLTTEDVAVLDDRACQLESWIDRSRVATQAWIVPACNFGAGIEWQAGFARTREQSRSFFSESYAQAKVVLMDPQQRGWGYGVVAGVARFVTRATHRHWEDPYAIVPVTLAADANTLVHMNVGWVRNRDTGRNATPWGLAAERAISPRVALVGEAFGVNRERPFLRAGATWAAMKALVFDLTVVTRPGGRSDERFLSLGLTWQGAR